MLYYSQIVVVINCLLFVVVTDLINKLKYQPEKLVTHTLNEEPYFLARLNINYGYSKIKAEQGLMECARYLSLVAHYQQRLTPSIAVDIIWHELILFTRLYFKICEQHLGRYIHLHPGGKKIVFF